MKVRRVLLVLAYTLAGCMLTAAPPAYGSPVAYLVNVTVRPGYNFANADQALASGNGLCAKMTAGRGYRDLIADVMADFHTTDDYQASYLIARAARELCLEQIWQLRNSAAGYTSPH